MLGLSVSLPYFLKSYYPFIAPFCMADMFLHVSYLEILDFDMDIFHWLQVFPLNLESVDSQYLVWVHQSTIHQ